MIRKTMLTAAAVAGVLAAAAPAQAKCVMAGGEGSNILPDVAKFMANAALNNSITGAGMKASGKAKVTCKGDLVMTTCVAKQKACK